MCGSVGLDCLPHNGILITREGIHDPHTHTMGDKCNVGQSPVASDSE